MDDDGRWTTEPSHPISSPEAFGSSEVKELLRRTWDFNKKTLYIYDFDLKVIDEGEGDSA